MTYREKIECHLGARFLAAVAIASVVGIVVFAAASYPHTVSAAIVLASVISPASAKPLADADDTSIRPFHIHVAENATCRSPPAHRSDALARPGNRSPISPRACNSRPCSNSRTIGRPTTIGEK